MQDQLEAAGYQTTVQPFLLDTFEELAAPAFDRVSPDPVTYTEADDFFTMEYSGSGDVTGALVPTNDVLVPPPAQPGSSSGCEPADFVPASATEPQVALVQRGTCDFTVKAVNAQAAGYDAVVRHRQGHRDGAVHGGLPRRAPAPLKHAADPSCPNATGWRSGSSGGFARMTR